jgi:hypothetical protein
MGAPGSWPPRARSGRAAGIAEASVRLASLSQRNARSHADLRSNGCRSARAKSTLAPPTGPLELHRNQVHTGACATPVRSHALHGAHGLAGAKPRCKAARAWASVRTRRAVALSASAPLLCLSGAKTCFCLLAGSLELAHACRAGGPLSIGLGLVQLVTLAGILSLCSQVVQMPGGQGVECRAGGGGRSVVALTRQRRASRRPLSVSGGV